jgi:hypothetical protein
MEPFISFFKPTWVLLITALLLTGCDTGGEYQAPKGDQTASGHRPPLGPKGTSVSKADLDREIAAIERASSLHESIRPEDSNPKGDLLPPVEIQRTPPSLAADHPKVSQETMTLVPSLAERIKRNTPKAAPEGAPTVAPPHNWRALNYVGNGYEPKHGVDSALLAPQERSRTRGFLYAFLMLNEQLSDTLEKELKQLGVEILGPHDSTLKVRVPANSDRLRAIGALSSVEWLGYPRPAQKIETAVRNAVQLYQGGSANLPVIISVFDGAALDELQVWLTSIKATVGRVDTQLNSVSAVVPADKLDELAGLDSVLFVELSRPGGGGHDESMAVMGEDYLRPGGSGTRFSGAPITFGILDTGFMVGNAAPTPHQDLNKFGCGRNFTSDAAGVWNDQNGHGTHVLATATGIGTAQARFRGVATGIGSSGSTRIRAAKIWNSANSGTETEELNGQDYMDDAPDCGSDRPQVVSVSGGTSGMNQTGTDARSRRLDQIVWDARQTWVVCSGNSGPGGGTIWTAGVAKNALTVGNVLDNGEDTIGDIANNSSRGPTGDGRMKPNVVATGTTIRSARAGTTNDYTDQSGCSMATPHVSGIAASIMEHYPEFRTLPHLMRAHLMATSLLHDNVSAPVNNSAAPDATRTTYGLGRVSPYVAHWAHLNLDGWSTHWAWRTVSRDQWAYRDIDVPPNTWRLVVAMTWDEPAASAGASAAVNYDLDLWLDREPFCEPDGKGQCGEWASQSWIDNVEYQIIDNPRPGKYRLKIINWNAPSFGLPAAVSATIIRGATAPNMQLSASASPSSGVPVGGTVTVTTTVANPSWVLSGVDLRMLALPAGVTLEGLETTREENIVMDFPGVTALSLGTIVQGDSRSATWRFRIHEAGQKVLRFRARSENGGVREQSVVVNTGT